MKTPDEIKAIVKCHDYDGRKYDLWFDFKLEKGSDKKWYLMVTQNLCYFDLFEVGYVKRANIREVVKAWVESYFGDTADGIVFRTKIVLKAKGC